MKSTFHLRILALFSLLVVGSSVMASDHKACINDFMTLCGDWPIGASLFSLCYAERYKDFSEECKVGDAKSAEEAAWSRCQENSNTHSPVLLLPEGATSSVFRRCGLSDNVSFRMKKAYPAQDVVDYLVSHWNRTGWVRNDANSDSWKLHVSDNRRTVARVRNLMFNNSKGQMVFLRILYIKTFDIPVRDTQVSNISFDDDPHFLESITPVRRYWDGMLPRFAGREIHID